MNGKVCVAVVLVTVSLLLIRWLSGADDTLADIVVDSAVYKAFESNPSVSPLLLEQVVFYKYESRLIRSTANFSRLSIDGLRSVKR